MAKPDLNKVINGAQNLVDLMKAGDGVVKELETASGLVRRLKNQRVKLAKSTRIMRPWHNWRVSVLEDRLRERLGLAIDAKLPV